MPFPLMKELQNQDQRFKLEDYRTIKQKEIIPWIIRKTGTSHFAEYNEKSISSKGA